MQEKELSIPNWGIFSENAVFKDFWTIKFGQKFETKSRNCGDSNDSNSQYKDKFQNIIMSAPKRSQPKVLKFCTFVSIKIE